MEDDDDDGETTRSKFGRKVVITSRTRPLSRRTSMTPTSMQTADPAGARRAPTYGICMRCTAGMEKTKVASSHLP